MISENCLKRSVIKMSYAYSKLKSKFRESTVRFEAETHGKETELI